MLNATIYLRYTYVSCVTLNMTFGVIRDTAINYFSQWFILQRNECV